VRLRKRYIFYTHLKKLNYKVTKILSHAKILSLELTFYGYVSNL
jgi:hypothetical protein